MIAFAGTSGRHSRKMSCDGLTSFCGSDGVGCWSQTAAHFLVRGSAAAFQDSPA